MGTDSSKSCAPIHADGARRGARRERHPGPGRDPALQGHEKMGFRDGPSDVKCAGQAQRPAALPRLTVKIILDRMDNWATPSGLATRVGSLASSLSFKA